MTISVAQFRADYPEFGSTAEFPASGVQFWLNAAYSFLNASRWGAQLDIGAELYTAHNIALEARAKAESDAGGVPGSSVGPANSKSVDKVSVGFDTTVATEKDAGHWNLTIYGTRLYRMILMFGAGPVQVGPGSMSPVYSGMAWPGPNTIPGFSNF